MRAGLHPSGQLESYSHPPGNPLPIPSQRNMLYERPGYKAEQALDGWAKVFAFLKKHLVAS